MKTKYLVNAVDEYFRSDKGKTVLHEAMSAALMREMHFTKHRDESGNPIVPPQEKTATVNVIDQLLVYLPRVEGAMRGVQGDLAKQSQAMIGIVNKLFETARLVNQDPLLKLVSTEAIDNKKG